MIVSKKKVFASIISAGLLSNALLVFADDELEDLDLLQRPPDPSLELIKNLDLIGEGNRDDGGSTTDVWAHEGFAYTGTFGNPCGGEDGAGVWVWDVKNKKKPGLVGVIPSPTGSRSNDVKVAAMNSGDILVHSNESCAGGPGGFEIYNVDAPANPIHLASVQTDDVNVLLRDGLGFTDFGVHNLFCFTRATSDYVAATVESEFGNFQIFDITDPYNPTLVGHWGAESLLFPSVDFATTTDFGGVILPADAYLTSGFGASQNKFLHDITISADGTRAYLANWDAGLVLLDVSDVTSPQVVSVAIDPVNGSLDGEVNSHAVWPSEDGSVVVESEEDFSVFEAQVPFSGSLQFLNTIPGVGASTATGDAFEASQTGNAGTLTASSLSVTSGPLDGQSYAVQDMINNNHPLGGGSVSGNLVWAGRACDGDPLANRISTGDIAIVRRGDCFFSDKAANVAAAGAAAVVVANNLQDSTWGGLRIWDYSDPSNPVLASTFDTVCSANPSDTSCGSGTYSVHNVIVESAEAEDKDAEEGRKVWAYVSWYSDGMLVLDITDPYNPVEFARYKDHPANNFWGVYKVPSEPTIYGSDRFNGLKNFKLKGAGSKK